MAELTAAALAKFHDDLLAAYGPQYWWPTQDRDNARFEILIGAILTQHTAWTHVEIAIDKLRRAGPLSPQVIREHADLASLIQPAGPHNVKAERLRALCDGFIDVGGFETLDRLADGDLRQTLMAWPGIGGETADAIAVYAFGRAFFIADAYAFRIFERLGWWSGKRRYERLRREIEAVGFDRDAAFYDELHALIVAHAKQRCHKQRPDCDACCVSDRCAHAAKRD